MAKGRIVGPGTFLKRSPNKFLGAVTGIVGGVTNLIGGNSALGAAEAQQRRAQQELNKRKEELLANSIIFKFGLVAEKVFVSKS